jgi:hypothetical protein
LFDSDQQHAEITVQTLRVSGYAISWCGTIAEVLVVLNQTNFDIVVISSLRAQEWKTHLEQIQRTIRERPRQPKLVCLARVYRGPEERLEAERHGLRFVYER